MVTHPIRDVIDGFLCALAPVDDLGLKLGNQHSILANLASGCHVWNVLNQEVTIADFEMKTSSTKRKQVLATSD